MKKVYVIMLLIVVAPLHVVHGGSADSGIDPTDARASLIGFIGRAYGTIQEKWGDQAAQKHGDKLLGFRSKEEVMKYLGEIGAFGLVMPVGAVGAVALAASERNAYRTGKSTILQRLWRRVRRVVRGEENQEEETSRS